MTDRDPREGVESIMGVEATPPPERIPGPKGQLATNPKAPLPADFMEDLQATRRCPHDGAGCSHACAEGEVCARYTSGHHRPAPWPGFPREGFTFPPPNAIHLVLDDNLDKAMTAPGGPLHVPEEAVAALREAFSSGEPIRVLEVVDVALADPKLLERIRWAVYCAELDAWKDKAEHLRMQAVGWAQEARTCRAVVHELYTMAGCGRTIPRPVTGSLDPMRHVLERLKDAEWGLHRLYDELRKYQRAMERAVDLGAAQQDADGKDLAPVEVVENLASRRYSKGYAAGARRTQGGPDPLDRVQIDRTIRALGELREAIGGLQRARADQAR